MMLGLLLQLLTGCFVRTPTAPGTSAKLQYPILLFKEDGFTSRKDEGALITTNTATGIVYEEYTILDSSGAQYSVGKVSAFNQPRAGDFFSMGTTPFQVFLDLRPHGAPNLPKTKEALKAIALRLEEVRNKKLAAEDIDGARSFAELVTLCSSPWDWR